MSIDRLVVLTIQSMDTIDRQSLTLSIGICLCHEYSLTLDYSLVLYIICHMTIVLSYNFTKLFKPLTIPNRPEPYF